MKKILILCTHIDHINFYVKMEKAFSVKELKPVYIVLDLAIYIILKRKTLNQVVLIKKSQYECDLTNVKFAKDLIEGRLDLENAINIYKSVSYYSEKLNANYSFSYIISNQGINVAEIALKDFANKNNIPILFFELANIPGKTFWDKEGSNAKSYLYRHVGLLDEFDVSDNEYMIWRDKYVSSNLQKHVVKQAVNIRNFNYLYGTLSRISFLLTGLKLRRLDFGSKFKQMIKSRSLKMAYDEYNISQSKYLFFPMQVASDSQIILNSDIGLMEAVELVVSKAKESGLDLVIKLHPAEKDVNVIAKLLDMREKYGFKIVSDNTFDVILNANKVVTINSTVALEAMILDKNVEILGRSYYKFFNRERLKNYIMRYLVNMDQFSEEDFTENQIITLLERFRT